MAEQFRKFPKLTAAGTNFTLVESDITGLRGLLVETGEPLCRLHAVIATESDTEDWTHKDDGLPHTLEHAVFMGSEQFPFKGVLDKLANRSLADGTNAWTATDHTCYTMCSAGHEGCLNLLPIYADHILYPTLTDECFHTEVHHVTGEGEDKGVVYCEMQGRENTSGSLVDRKVLDLLYPEGGYSSETGGKMKNLRSLTNAQVCRYHREAYRPDNLLVVVSGTAGEAEFLAALGKVEAAVRQKGFVKGQGGFTRPWGRPVPPMRSLPGSVGVLTQGGNEGTPLTITFPSENEATGVVSLAWRGPRYEEQETWAALHLLWAYLTESAIAPLTKAFVEVATPLCSRVGPADEVLSEGYHQVWFQDAPVETMEQIRALFFKTVAAVIDDFDLPRMAVVIRRRRRKLLEERERAPTSAVIRNVIEHFLYAPRDVDPDAEVRSLAVGVDSLPHLAAAEKLTAADWCGLLHRFILNPPCVCVMGMPAASCAKEIAEEVSNLTEANKAAHGPAGLAELATKLKEAVAHNEREIPDQFLTAVPIPSYESVRSFPVLNIRGAASLAIAPNSGEGVPAQTATAILDGLNAARTSHGSGLGAYWTEFCHVDSAFVSVAVAMDTASLTPTQRLLLPLVLDVSFKLPCVLDDGASLSKDDFVAAVQEDTVRYDAGHGLIRGGLNQMVCVYVQTELGDTLDGLALALKWVRRALYLTVPTGELLQMAIQKELASIPAAVRSGNGIAAAISKRLEHHEMSSNAVASHAIAQQPFLQALKARLDTPDGMSAVLSEVAALRAELLQPARVNLFCAADLTKLAPNVIYQELSCAIIPPPAWPKAMATAPPAHPTAPLQGVQECTVLSRRAGHAVVCSLSAIESHFLTVSGAGIGPYSEDHAALLVAIEHLTALEGDFWVKLRGVGSLAAPDHARPSDGIRARCHRHAPYLGPVPRALVPSPPVNACCWPSCRRGSPTRTVSAPPPSPLG